MSSASRQRGVSHGFRPVDPVADGHESRKTGNRLENDSGWRSGGCPSSISCGLTQGDPSFAQAWYLLGSVNQLLGNTTESLANYERVLRLEPDHVATLNNVGVALQALGMAQRSGGQLANRPPDQARLRRGPQ